MTRTTSRTLALGIDVGTTNCKAVVVEAGGGVVRDVATAVAPTPSRGSELVDAVSRLIAEVVSASPRPPDCVGVASMAETGVPLDAADRPVGDLLAWNRGFPERQTAAEELVQALGSASLFAATGVRPSAKVPLAGWGYLRRHDPQRWSVMRRWAGAADLIVLALTGSLATDHTLAGRTMAYRLPGPAGSPGCAPSTALAADFDRDLLAVVGLRPDQLPRVVPPGEPAGLVRRDCAAAGALRPGTPVVVAGHDHAVAAWAAGVRAPGQVADSLGTAEALIAVLRSRPDPAEVAAEGMSLVRTVAGDREALVAGTASAGAMLTWWAEREGRRATLPRLLASVPARLARPTGVLVLPYLSGRQTPEPDPDARVEVRGPLDGLGGLDELDEVDQVRAILEGLSYQARWMLSTLTRYADTADPVPTDRAAVLALGGSAHAGSAWLQVKAAVGPGPLRGVSHPEPVAAGAALLAGVGTGVLDPAQARLPSASVERHPIRTYEPHYRRFVQAAGSGGQP